MDPVEARRKIFDFLRRGVDVFHNQHLAPFFLAVYDLQVGGLSTTALTDPSPIPPAYDRQHEKFIADLFIELHTTYSSSLDTTMQPGYMPQQGYPPQQRTHSTSSESETFSPQPMQQQQPGGYPPHLQPIPQQHQQQQVPPSSGGSGGSHSNEGNHGPSPMGQPMMMPQQQPMMVQQHQPTGPPVRLTGGEQWMIMPAIPVGLTIPPGLEFLLPCAGAHVRQKTDLIEVLTTIDTPNKYGIYNDQGQFMYYAKEQQGLGGFVEAQLLGDNRGFYFMCTDGLGRPAFSISRSSKLWTDCEMVVEAPPGCPAGFVSYNSSLCSRGCLTVFDAGRRPVLSVPFPSECDCGGDRGYMVVSGSATVGAIVRKYPGFMKAAFTNCDNFALSFPVDLDVRVKCTLLACAIMIDFIDFEDKRDGRTAQRYNS